MAVYPASGKAVDDKDLARRKRRDSFQTPSDVKLLVLCQDYNGNVRHFWYLEVLYINPLPIIHLSLVLLANLPYTSAARFLNIASISGSTSRKTSISFCPVHLEIDFET